MTISKLNLLFFVGVTAFLCSCRTSCEIGTYGEEIGPEPRIVEGKATRAIYSSDKSDSTEFKIDYAYFSRLNSSYVMDSSFKDSVNTVIYEAVRSATFSESDLSPEPLTEHFFSAQLDTLAEMYEYEEGDDEYATLWDLEMWIGIQDFSSFVEVNISGWSYTGGAHGNSQTYYTLINRENGKELGLNDFFTDLDALNAIAEPLFRSMKELEEDALLSDNDYWFDNDEFTVNENFTFDNTNVSFYYNFYEIAPYVMGPTELIIPLDKIKHLLKLDL